MYLGQRDELGEREIFSKLTRPRVRYDVEVVTKLVVYAGKLPLSSVRSFILHVRRGSRIKMDPAFSKSSLTDSHNRYRMASSRHDPYIIRAHRATGSWPSPLARSFFMSTVVSGFDKVVRRGGGVFLQLSFLAHFCFFC